MTVLKDIVQSNSNLHSSLHLTLLSVRISASIHGQGSKGAQQWINIEPYEALEEGKKSSFVSNHHLTT